MPRENIESKGRRYIAEGRLILMSVNDTEIQAICHGNGEFYRLGYKPGGWWCDCPALGRCAHLVALQCVTVRPGGGR